MPERCKFNTDLHHTKFSHPKDLVPEILHPCVNAISLCSFRQFNLCFCAWRKVTSHLLFFCTSHYFFNIHVTFYCLQFSVQFSDKINSRVLSESEVNLALTASWTFDKLMTSFYFTCTNTRGCQPYSRQTPYNPPFTKHNELSTVSLS